MLLFFNALHIVHLTEDSLDTYENFTPPLLKMFKCTANPEGKFLEVHVLVTKWVDERGQTFGPLRQEDLPQF